MGHCAGCDFAGMCGGPLPLRVALTAALRSNGIDDFDKAQKIYDDICGLCEVSNEDNVYLTETNPLVQL